jgi:hypothetical protein
MSDASRMSIAPISELVVPYDAGLVAEKVNRRRRMVISRLINVALTIAVLTVLYLWQRDQLRGAGYLVILGVLLAVPVIWFVVVLVGYRRARKELASVGSGRAVRMGPPGVQVGALYAPWSDVASLGAVRTGIGRAPVLRLTTTNGDQASVSFEQIPTYPATLDATARAFSGGRHGVDLTALDN